MLYNCVVLFIYVCVGCIIAEELCDLHEKFIKYGTEMKQLKEHHYSCNAHISLRATFAWKSKIPAYLFIYLFSVLSCILFIRL